MTQGRSKPRHSMTKAAIRMRLSIVLLILDVLAVGMSFWATGQTPYFASSHGVMDQIMMLCPIYVIVAMFTHSYSPQLITRGWSSVGRTLKSLAMSTTGIILIAFFLKTSSDWSRAGFITGVSISAITLILVRVIFARHARNTLNGEPYAIVILHDGPPETAPHPAAISLDIRDSAPPAIQAATNEAPTNYDPLSQASVASLDPCHPSPAALDQFACKIASADRVIIHCPPERRIYWVNALKATDVQGELATPEIAPLHPLGSSSYNGEPTLIVSRGPFGIKDRFIKRAFDLTIAITALIALSPLMLMVMLLIWLQDRGPVFFTQTRVGRSNRQFRIYKFRSMYVADQDPDGNCSTLRHDNRITPVGRFIRATSIDELPQLYNVLKGDMSIVGPRPHALGSTAENLLFWHIDERYWQRHVIKPGITGLAQVRGYRGATESKEDLVNRLQSDFEYMMDWTIWRDVMIVLRTIGVLFHDNAY